MKLDMDKFYRILSPRPAVLISTIDKEGQSNAAPFSFVMPVSGDPPLVAIASAHKRHTLANIRQTMEFVVNIVPEDILDELWICAKSFEKGVSEIKESGLTESSSKMIKAPGVQESVGWLECLLDFEIDAGDHVIVVGKVVNAEVKDEYVDNGTFNVQKAKPLMHVTGKDFAVPGQVIQPKL